MDDRLADAERRFLEDTQLLGGVALARLESLFGLGDRVATDRAGLGERIAARDVLDIEGQRIDIARHERELCRHFDWDVVLAGESVQPRAICPELGQFVDDLFVGQINQQVVRGIVGTQQFVVDRAGVLPRSALFVVVFVSVVEDNEIRRIVCISASSDRRRIVHSTVYKIQFLYTESALSKPSLRVLEAIADAEDVSLFQGRGRNGGAGHGKNEGRGGNPGRAD